MTQCGKLTTWQAGARDNAGSLQWYRTQPHVVALLTAPGAMLIQNGQEFGEDHWIMEDDGGSNRRVKPRPLRWDFPGDAIGSRLVALYARLIKIRRAHPALRSDNFYPGGWEAWVWEPGLSPRARPVPELRAATIAALETAGSARSREMVRQQGAP